MRIALGIEYAGTHYHGWQSQTALTTVQTRLEAALTKVAAHPVRVVCAGRTDAGVHALGQVVHFDCEVARSEHAWVLGTNTYLPPDIRVHWAKVVSEDFHARFSALARRYHYLIDNAPTASAVLYQRVTSCRRFLDEKRMQAAASYLVGEHDFTSFRGMGCQAKSPIRTVYHCDVVRRGNFIMLDVKANAFLHHMVRNIAGVLMAIGAGKKTPLWAQEVLIIKDRTLAGVTASPQGLYLVEVTYPEQFALPKTVVRFPC